ncbi:MAG TPA: adenylate/guanylate cyclase domain-containing protein, partial [Kofleriaceae bacterium]|nr:adenylate/guanylate cyclase domain-containing protein [Kofleriaceae bacterium]
ERTLAEGALQGERRAAVARLFMVVMFGGVTEILPLVSGIERDPFQLRRLLAGAGYTLFALSHLIVLHRIHAGPGKSMVMPLITTVIDFSFITFMGVTLSIDYYRPEMHAVAAAVLLSFAVARLSMWHVAWSTACACASYAACAAAYGRLDERSTPFVIGGFLTLGMLIGVTNREVRAMFRDLRRRDNLTRFLPARVAERIMSGGGITLAPVQREVTVLFSDIRGFTALSEHLAPREVLALLDEYFGRMTQVVKGHDGVVGKFLGDGMLAFWNVPDRDPDHAANAVKAALDMLRVLAEMNRAREQAGLAALNVGIGIHTGAVAAGMLGGAEQAEYTVIGDAVNLASRIEGLTKSLGAVVLVSASTWSLLGDRFAGKRLAAESIRGREGSVVLYAMEAPGA